MANTIMFDEGMADIYVNGFPSTCYFLLSTKSVDATNPFAVTDTLAATHGGEIRDSTTCTGYARQSLSRSTLSSGHTKNFAQMTWTTASATDWPATVRSIVLVTVDRASDASGKMICAANLQSGGVARDMSQANTTEKVTPTLVFAAGN